VLGFVVVQSAVTLAPGLNETPLRVVLGLPFVLFNVLVVIFDGSLVVKRALWRVGFGYERDTSGFEFVLQLLFQRVERNLNKILIRPSPVIHVLFPTLASPMHTVPTRCSIQ
jgi:hypothetical protein